MKSMTFLQQKREKLKLEKKQDIRYETLWGKN